MKVTVVIPNYNGKHFLAPCLEALARQTCQDFQILIVDNASEDGSIDFLETEYPNVKYIVLDKNYGFSKAVNIGIRSAKTPYVFLLNNDTKIAPTCIQELLNTMETSRKIFSVSSKMIQMYHPELIDSAGDLYTVIGWGVCRGNGRPVSLYQTPEPIFSACAGAAMYRTRIFQKIGYFDENHFAYLEDIDIGYRAKIFGYQNVYCPTAIVEHVGSGTSGSKYNAFKVRISARNSVYLNYKNMPILQLFFNFLPLCIGYLVKYLFFCKIGFGKEYKEGVQEGLHKCRAQAKVPFRFRHLLNYFRIEGELIRNTFSYAKDWVQRKVLKK